MVSQIKEKPCKKMKIIKIPRKHPVENNRQFLINLAWKNSAIGRVTSDFREGKFTHALHTINKHVGLPNASKYFDFWNKIVQQVSENEILMLAADVNDKVFLSNGPPAPF